MKLLQRKSKKKGFTLVELMVVIAIIAVLLLVAVPKLSDSTKGSKVRTFEANFRTLMSAANAAYADAGMDLSKVNATTLDAALKSVTDRPTGATYTAPAAPAGGTSVTEAKIIGTLPGSVIGATGEYKLEFEVGKGTLTITAGDDFKSYVTMKKIE